MKKNLIFKLSEQLIRLIASELFTHSILSVLGINFPYITISLFVIHIIKLIYSDRYGP